MQKLNPFNRKAPVAAAPSLVTHMPQRDFENWVAANLDVRSFNNSQDGRRETYQARFRELGYAPPPPRFGRGPVVVTLESKEGVVALSLFERGDHNHDGVEDVVICIDDLMKDGSYHRVQALLAQKYADDGPLVALDVDIRDRRCQPSGR
jgi:hypothetical protein